MKKIFLLLTPLLLLATTNTEQRLKSLEKEITELKKIVQYQQEDLDERMPIIENIEKKTILDKINFSPELELRFDKMDYKSGEISGENTKIQNHSDPSLIGLQRRDEFSKNFDIATTIKFKLNMNVILDEKIKFYGRMLYTVSSQANQRLCILSRDIKSVSSSSAFDVDRAYVNYTPNKNSAYPFTFSFGLLPTTGGTPMQYGQSKTRQSMFPALVFDMNTYGIIATQKLGENTFLRGTLAKAYTLRANFYPYQCNRENIDNANVVGLYADTKFDFIGKSLLSFGVNVLHDLKAHPYLGPDVNAEDASVLGTMATFGIGIDIDKVAQSDTTIFLHTALSHPHPNGEIDNYQIQTDENGIQIDPNDIGFSTAEYAQGSMLNDNGYSLYIGMKHKLNSKLSIGTEYNHGSKYWFSATQGAEDMYNKLATRGDVGEIYGIWKFYKKIDAKAGYLYSKENYTGSGWHFGEPANKDATQNIAYITINARF